MKRFVLALVLVATSATSLQPVWAGDRYASYAGYPYPSQPVPQEPAKDGHPILRKLLIGGLLVGVGFVAGRLTAPKPQPYYPGYLPPPHPTHRAAYPSHYPAHYPVHHPVHQAAYGHRAW